MPYTLSVLVAIPNYFGDNSHTFEKEIVENITSKAFLQRHALTASTVQAAVKGLMEKDFITSDRGKYEVYDKFFGLWLRS